MNKIKQSIIQDANIDRSHFNQLKQKKRILNKIISLAKSKWAHSKKITIIDSDLKKSIMKWK